LCHGGAAVTASASACGVGCAAAVDDCGDIAASGCGGIVANGLAANGLVANRLACEFIVAIDGCGGGCCGGNDANQGETSGSSNGCGGTCGTSGCGIVSNGLVPNTNDDSDTSGNSEFDSSSSGIVDATVVLGTATSTSCSTGAHGTGSRFIRFR
jgi:hypothetical protein